MIIFDLENRSCTSSIDLKGIGSTFDNIAFRSKDHIYRMPKDLALPCSPPMPAYAPPTCLQATLLTLYSSAIAIQPATKKSDLPPLSGTPPLKPCKPGQVEELTEDESCLVDETLNVFGVDLREYIELQRGESVYEKFMREEGLIESLWGLTKRKSRNGV